MNEMVNTVAQVWGVRRETLDKDVSEITSGMISIEQVCGRIVSMSG